MEERIDTGITKGTTASARAVRESVKAAAVVPLTDVSADDETRSTTGIGEDVYKRQEYDKVIGLDSGADDYVTKPFGMMELVSRIKAVLRRSGKVEDRMDMDISGVHVNVKKHEVTVDGKEVSLTLKEFELLEKLMRNQGIVLTRDQLLTEIWGYDFDGETRTVDVHIRTLRQKMGEKMCIRDRSRNIQELFTNRIHRRYGMRDPCDSEESVRKTKELISDVKA